MHGVIDKDRYLEDEEEGEAAHAAGMGYGYDWQDVLGTEVSDNYHRGAPSSIAGDARREETNSVSA